MPSIEYNSWEAGIGDDDYIAPKGTYIEGENVTGLFTGYGITLGPKISKQLLTNYMPRTIFGESTNFSNIAVGCDHGEIYRLTSTDLTPIYTLTNNWNILNGAMLGNYVYFASKIPSLSSTSARIMQVTFSDFQNGSFASANETFISFNNIETPPLLVTSKFLYVGGLSNIYRIDQDGIIVTFSLWDDYILGISTHGSQLQIYTRRGTVSYWDGVSESVSANITLGFLPTRVTGQTSYDNIATDDGDYYLGSGYDFKLVSRAKSSARLEDNTQYINKLTFKTDTFTGQVFAPARNGVYILSSDTIPGIYQRDFLIDGLPVGYNKVTTKDHTGTYFDALGTITYLSLGSTVSKLFFGYQSNTTIFGVDYIDLDSNNACEDGYLVTNIFRGPPNKENKIEEIRMTTSYTSGDNYIKLYRRINNGTWILIRTINNDTNTIEREPIQNQGDEFIDIQFKIELHNDGESDFPPILHELELIYSIIGE